MLRSVAGERRRDALDAHLEARAGPSSRAPRRRHEHARVRRVADEHADELGADGRLVAGAKRQRVDAARARRAHREPLARQLQRVERSARCRNGRRRLLDLLGPRALRELAQLRLGGLGLGAALVARGERLVDRRLRRRARACAAPRRACTRSRRRFAPRAPARDWRAPRRSSRCARRASSSARLRFASRRAGSRLRRCARPGAARRARADGAGFDAVALGDVPRRARARRARPSRRRGPTRACRRAAPGPARRSRPGPSHGEQRQGGAGGFQRAWMPPRP